MLTRAQKEELHKIAGLALCDFRIFETMVIQLGAVEQQSAWSLAIQALKRCTTLFETPAREPDDRGSR